VRTPEQLARLAQSLAGSPALALDTESDSLHHHVEKVCLIQIAPTRRAASSTPRRARPLAPRPDPADRAWPRCSTAPTTTDHPSDFGPLRRPLRHDDRRALPGRPQIGLRRWPRPSWGRPRRRASATTARGRPLPAPTQGSTRRRRSHLLVLPGLAAELRRLGRLAGRGGSDAVAALEPAPPRPRRAYQKARGMRRLTRRRQAVLREIHGWRERLAGPPTFPPSSSCQPGRPRAGRARRGPRGAGAGRGLSPRVRGRGGEPSPPSGAPSSCPSRTAAPQRRPAAPGGPEPVRKRIESLRAWRTTTAAVAVDISVVAAAAARAAGPGVPATWRRSAG
jgi:hypothetical protein